MAVEQIHRLRIGFDAGVHRAASAAVRLFSQSLRLLFAASLFPFLFLVFWFVVIRAIFCGGPWRRGWHAGTSWDVPQGFDEWHRRAHERMMLKAIGQARLVRLVGLVGCGLGRAGRLYLAPRATSPTCRTRPTRRTRPNDADDSRRGR